MKPLLQTMTDFLKKGSLCALATCFRDIPHSSLMTYLTDEDGFTVYVVTLAASRKYGNMIQNPRVSLLVDSRLEEGPGTIQALTVHALSAPVLDTAEKAAILARFLRCHPHMEELATHPDAEVIALRVQSFLLLDGPTRAQFVHVTPES